MIISCCGIIRTLHYNAITQHLVLSKDLRENRMLVSLILLKIISYNHQTSILVIHFNMVSLISRILNCNCKFINFAHLICIQSPNSKLHLTTNISWNSYLLNRSIGLLCSTFIETWSNLLFVHLFSLSSF